MSDITDIQIKCLPEDDLMLPHQWMFNEQWTSVSKKEIRDWYGIYPEGFLGAYNSEGQLLCFIFSRCLNEQTALIEMFIASPDMRGRGVGTKLLQHVIESNPNHNTVLVAVRGKEPFYEKRGLKLVGIKIIRIYDMIPKSHQQLPAIANDGPGYIIEDFHNCERTVEMIVDYDRSNHGLDRKGLIQLYSVSSDCATLVAKDDIAKTILGLIVVKKTDVNYKIVAFNADSLDIAEKLLRRGIAECTDPKLKFCVAFPSINNTNATQLYHQVFDTVDAKRFEENFLATKGVVEKGILWEKVYSVTELGYISFL